MSLQLSGAVDTSGIDPNGVKKPAANTPGRCTYPVSAGMPGSLTGTAGPAQISLLSPCRP